MGRCLTLGLVGYRMDADELARFLIAANGDVTNFIAKVKKTVQWRERHHIFSANELKRWEHLVYWHGRDAEGRPALIIRLGLAFTVLDRSDHPGFAQAVGTGSCRVTNFEVTKNER